GYTLVFCCQGPATPEIYTLSLHDALPISVHVPEARHAVLVGAEQAQQLGGEGEFGAVEGHQVDRGHRLAAVRPGHLLPHHPGVRSEEHTSELQSRENLVCRLLLEKKNRKL